MHTRRLPIIAAVAALMFTGAPADGAAQAAATPPDTDELVTFTEAFVEISEVREEMTPRIMQAQDAEEASQLQAEANDQMIGILTDHELDPERYNTITQLINTDPELQAEFEAILQEITGGGV